MEPIEIIAKHLNVQPEDISEERYDYYGLPVFSYGREEYAVAINDDEADQAATENIKELLWAFNSDFIVGECGLPYELAEVFQEYQQKKCESANDAILSLVEKTCGLEKFVQHAIAADGRGNFLGQYDDNEIVTSEYAYIYRIN
jgi:hypothetical protein